MLWTSEQDKERMVIENKVVFDAGHPVWGVKNIPDPDWEYIKWWKKTRNKTPKCKILHKVAKAGQVWRVAKLLEYRMGLEDQDKFSTKTWISSYTASGHVISKFKGEKATALIQLLFAHGGANGDMFCKSRLEGFLNNGDVEIAVAYFEHEMIDNDGQIMMLEHLAKDKAHIDVCTKICKAMLSRDRDALIDYLIEKVQGNNKYVPAILTEVDCQLSSEALDILLVRNKLETVQLACEVLIDCGANVQSCLEDNYRKLTPDKILYLQKRGADISPSKLQNTGNKKCEEWNLITDQKIEHIINQGNGSSIKFIFDFAAKSVKTIERIPGEAPATFQEIFSDIANGDLDQAANVLRERGGNPDWVAKSDKQTALPLPGQQGGS